MRRIGVDAPYTVTVNNAMADEIVKTSFDFCWRKDMDPSKGQFALKHNLGNVLDVGCGTGMLYEHLQRNGWNGKYTGIDTVRYSSDLYPKGIQIIIEDALKLPFPTVDTCIAYDVLEHTDAPVGLLSKCLQASKNVLVSVPKRNENLWRNGVVEYHQLDKTHRHCGFVEEELRKLAEKANGKVATYEEICPTKATSLNGLWKSRIPRLFNKGFARVFASEVFYQVILAEITPN
jgi:SAM-dependent methyltransferase